MSRKKPRETEDPFASIPPRETFDAFPDLTAFPESAIAFLTGRATDTEPSSGAGTKQTKPDSRPASQTDIEPTERPDEKPDFQQAENEVVKAVSSSTETSVAQAGSAADAPRAGDQDSRPGTADAPSRSLAGEGSDLETGLQLEHGGRRGLAPPANGAAAETTRSSQEFAAQPATADAGQRFTPGAVDSLSHTDAAGVLPELQGTDPAQDAAADSISEREPSDGGRLRANVQRDRLAPGRADAPRTDLGRDTVGAPSRLHAAQPLARAAAVGPTQGHDGKPYGERAPMASGRQASVDSAQSRPESGSTDTAYGNAGDAVGQDVETGATDQCRC